MLHILNHCRALVPNGRPVLTRSFSRTISLNKRACSPFAVKKPKQHPKFKKWKEETPFGEMMYRGRKRAGRGRDVAIVLRLRHKVFLGLMALGGMWYLAHLEQVPLTGRWRYMTMDEKEEAEMGKVVKLELFKTEGHNFLSSDHELTLMARRIVSRILASSNLGHVKQEQVAPAPLNRRPIWDIFGIHRKLKKAAQARSNVNENLETSARSEKEWEVYVIDDNDTVNAFAIPGLVAVYTGILDLCEDEEGLAAVLSHEIGHVVARHSAETISGNAARSFVFFALQVLGIDAFSSYGIIRWILELPNSRTKEYEADLIGLRLMSQACYNPRAISSFFERLYKFELDCADGERDYEFLGTHPYSDKRAKVLEEALSEGYRILEGNPRCADVVAQLAAFRQAASDVESKTN